MKSRLITINVSPYFEVAFEPVRKVTNMILATKHSKRSIIVKGSLSFVCNFVSLVKGAGKGDKHHWKVLQRRSTEETEKEFSETTPCNCFFYGVTY